MGDQPYVDERPGWTCCRPPLWRVQDRRAPLVRDDVLAAELELDEAHFGEIATPQEAVALAATVIEHRTGGR